MRNSDGRTPSASPAARVALGCVAALHLVQFAAVLRVPGLRDLYLLDSRVYDEMADAFRAHGFFGGDAAFGHAPLYPLMLAALRAVGLDAAWVPLAFQVALGIASVAAVGELARRIFGASAQAPALCLFGLYAPAVMLETKLMATTLGVALLLLTLLLLIQREQPLRPWRVAVAGLVLGCACLVRPNTLLFAPLAALWLGVVAWRGGSSLPRVAGLVALWFAGVALAIAPVSARNHRVADEFVLITAHGGMTLFQSNNEAASGVYSPIPGATGNPRLLAETLRAQMEARTGGPVSLTEVDRAYRDRALRFLAEDPVRAVALVARKLRYWLGNDEVSTEYTVAAERIWTPTLWLFPVPFAVILGLAVLGVGQRVREPGTRPGAALLGLFLLSNAATIAVFYFSSRYRVPAVPVLCVFAGAGVASLIETLRLRRLRKTAPALALATVVTLFSLVPVSDIADRYAFQQWFNYGLAQQERGEIEAAVVSFERARNGLPEGWRIQLALARAYVEVGRLREAAAGFERVIELRPQSRGAREGLEAVRARLDAADGSG